MKRVRYLVAYDIRDPKRLRKVHKVMKGHGDAMQYSVFICDLTAAERAVMVDRLATCMDPSRDRVAIIKVGETSNPEAFWFMGPAAELPRGGPTIV